MSSDGAGMVWWVTRSVRVEKAKLVSRRASSSRQLNLMGAESEPRLKRARVKEPSWFLVNQACCCLLRSCWMSSGEAVGMPARLMMMRSRFVG